MRSTAIVAALLIATSSYGEQSYSGVLDYNGTQTGSVVYIVHTVFGSGEQVTTEVAIVSWPTPYIVTNASFGQMVTVMAYLDSNNNATQDIHEAWTNHPSLLVLIGELTGIDLTLGEYDTDLDGLSDYEEVNIYGTNPNLADSDGDTLSDFVEVMTHLTNPNLADSDNDGLRDDEELFTGSDGYVTDPMDADTDGDFASDGQEVQAGTSPLDEFDVLELMLLTSGNMLHNSTFEEEGSTSFKSLCWEYNVPNVNGADFGSGGREEWHSFGPGVASAVVKGLWAGQGTYGGCWQEVRGLPGQKYRVGAYFLSDSDWSPTKEAILLEFWQGDMTGTNLLAVYTNEFTSTSSWTWQEVRATAPAGTDWVRMVVFADGVSALGALSFDNCRLDMVNMPTENNKIFTWRTKPATTYRVYLTDDLMVEPWSVYEVEGDGSVKSWTNGFLNSLTLEQLFVGVGIVE